MKNIINNFYKIECLYRKVNLDEHNINNWIKELAKLVNIDIIHGPKTIQVNKKKYDYTSLTIFDNGQISLNIYKSEETYILNLNIYSWRLLNIDSIENNIKNLIGNYEIEQKKYITNDDNIIPTIQQDPTSLNFPAIVMNFPYSLRRNYDQNVYNQFMNLYHQLSKESLVYLLPSLGQFEDQVFVANIGTVLHHIPDKKIFILSKYERKIRRGEEISAKPFFDMLGYNTVLCPYKFEGEAELKYIGGKNYIGHYYWRSQKKTFDWMEKMFDMNIIRVKMKDKIDDPKHLDCALFQLTNDITLVTEDLFSKKDIEKIKKFTKVIPIPLEYQIIGKLSNSVRLNNNVYTSCLSYGEEAEAFNFMNNICNENNLKLHSVCLEEFHKHGGDLSCLVLNLNLKYIEI